jgi:hypothetical protein
MEMIFMAMRVQLSKPPGDVQKIRVSPHRQYRRWRVVRIGYVRYFGDCIIFCEAP